MPKLLNIINSGEKRLDITEYCKDFLENEDEKAYITIRKMPYSLKRKVHLLTMESLAGKAGKQYLKKLKEMGLSISDLEKLEGEKALDFMISLDIDLKEQQEISNFGDDVQRLILTNCILPDKHNFIDNNNELIQINDYNFWEKLGDERLIKFVISEIKTFSESFGLKKKNVKR